MSLSQFATLHIKAVLFVTVVICAIGAWLIGSFPVAILPEVTFPRLVVIAESGDRPARMMVAGVTRPIEEAIATVPGVTRMRSKTQRGATQVSVDFTWGTDMLTALQLVNTKVNEARPQLPPETDISVERMNPTVFPILGLSLQAKGLSQAQLWTLATYTLRPLLARVPGVARVVVQGGRVPEIAVTVDPRRLAAYHLSLPDVEQALAQTNVVRSVGRMDRQFQQYQVLVSGETTAPEQIGNIVVVQRGGVPIYLKQLADIGPSVQDRMTMVTADGAEAVLINIVRQPDANTVAAVEGVRRELARVRPTLPPGVRIGLFYDQSVLIGEAVGSVRDAVLIGAALSVIVLLLFLGNIRATLVTAAIIPITVLITFLLMRLSGLTLNLMTLGALAVATGLVIDDAIVVVENVFRHLSGGGARDRIVQQASTEIAAPMISSTLTTVVVFLPLVLVAGVAGAFFTALAVTLTIALMVSLGLALLVSPSLCAAFLRVQPGTPEHGRLFDRAIRFYNRLLSLGLRRHWIMPVAAVVIVGLTLSFARSLGTGFMPTMDEGAFILDYVTPPGTSLTESDRLLRKIEAILHDTPEVAGYSRRTGTEMGFFITEPNSGDFAVVLKRGHRRKIESVMDDVRDRITAEVPGVDVDFMQVLQDLIGDLAGAPDPVEVKLFGESQEQLDALGRAVAAKLEKVPGVVDVRSGVVESGPELVARVDPTKAGRAGLTPDMVAAQVQAAMFGDVATQILQGDRQVGVRVRYPAAFRADRMELAALPIRTPGGFNLPLGALARIEPVPGTTEVNRENQRRLVAVKTQLSGRDLGSVMRDVQSVMRGVSLPAGVTYELGGQFRSQSESFRNLLAVLLLAILLVFGVMLFQFGSFTAPLVIVLVMPLSLFGVSLGLAVTHTSLNVSSFMGAIMLVGIVVKNGILLLDRAQKAEQEGMPLEEAVQHAGEVRLRPILMTTMTAILGLVPLALGLGAGAEMQQPLAIAVIGGLTFSTLFTLFFAPLLYVALRRWQTRADNHTMSGRTPDSLPLLVSIALFVTFGVLTTTPAHGQSLQVGRWQLAFAGPKGVQLAFDGVPVIRQSTLNVVKPGWTGSLYSEAATTHRLQTRAQGEARVMTVEGANDLFTVRYELTLRPDHTATLALTYELLQDVPADLEYCAGYINANLIACRSFQADTDGGPRQGVVPFLPATPDQHANDLTPGWSRLTFDSRLGKLTLRVQSDEPRVVFFDARRDPQTWAQDAPIFWLGLGSPPRPLVAHHPRRFILDLALEPNRDRGEWEATRRHGDTEVAEGGTESKGASTGPRRLDGATGDFGKPVASVEERAAARLPRARVRPVRDAFDPRGRPPLIIPRPKEVRYRREACRLSSRCRIVAVGPPEARRAAEALRRELQSTWGLALPVTSRERPGSATTLFLEPAGAGEKEPSAPSDAAWRGNPEGYLLDVERRGARVEAGTAAGAFYGVQTLAQLLRHGRKDGVEIVGARVADWPSFPFRGAHMFPSGAEPEFDHKLIDRVMSRYKLNRLVLEVENAQWKSHPELNTPQGASLDQLAALADLCRERFIEVVPLVQSLGHAQWMFANDQHRELAEDPDEPYAYCPSNSKAYELLFDIYDEAIRLFRPLLFHIGHDEITNRGQFPHDPACREKGLNRLFAEDVTRLSDFLHSRGVRPMLWGDMLLAPTEAPDAANAVSVEEARELRSLLSREAMVADWHYAGVTEYPSLSLFRDAGFQTVAAGWWNPLNVAYLARAARAAGAAGLLQTTWVGRFPTERVLGSEARQYVAMLLASEYAWSGRTDLPEEWDYTPGEQFARAWAAASPENAARPGALVDPEAIATRPLSGKEDGRSWPGLGGVDDLSGLPHGRTRLADVAFRLPSGRAAMLGSRLAGEEPRVIEIALDRPVGELALLNATAWSVPAGTAAARMTVTYADGGSQTLDLVAGRNTAAWTDARAAAEAPIAWRGHTGAGHPVSLRVTRWPNPRPEMTLRSVRVEPLDPEAAWTLFGLTILGPPVSAAAPAGGGAPSGPAAPA